MEQRMEFVALARQPGANRRELCRRFGIGAETGYKWLRRAEDGGPDWAQDRSRRPQTSPARSTAELEAAVVAVRDRHPAWGARKIRRWLRPGIPGAEQQAFGDALLARHKFVVIPSAVSTRSWNLIFVAATAAGAYAVRSQEPFALDPRLHRAGSE